MSETEKTPLSETGPSCAHLRVKWVEEQDPFTKCYTGWWECFDCRTKFMPVPVHKYEIEELERENNANRALLKDAAMQVTEKEAEVTRLRAMFSDLAVEMEKHSNDHIHDAIPENLQAAVEGVCADRINAILNRNTIETSNCKWCIGGSVPELSPHTKTYIHRFDTLDRPCESQFSWNHKNIEQRRETREFLSARAALAASAPQAAQGPCEVTGTERFANPQCKCKTYKENLGPCKNHLEGANGRCVYCDHELDCQPASREIPIGTVIPKWGEVVKAGRAYWVADSNRLAYAVDAGMLEALYAEQAGTTQTEGNK